MQRGVSRVARGRSHTAGAQLLTPAPWAPRRPMLENEAPGQALAPDTCHTVWHWGWVTEGRALHLVRRGRGSSDNSSARQALS